MSRSLLLTACLALLLLDGLDAFRPITSCSNLLYSVRCGSCDRIETSFSRSAASRLSLSAVKDIEHKAVTVIEYEEDNILERGAIFLLSLALALLSAHPLKSLRNVGPSYTNFVQTSHDFMAERTPSQMKDKLVGLLSLVIPSVVKRLFREKYEEMPQVVKENSVIWFSFNFLRFLVGPAEVAEDSNTNLLLLQCRYLHESGCKSSCLNLCQQPTQTFFNEVLGFPFRMKPNFEDSSCVFEFGVVPPELDEALDGKCPSGCKQICSNVPGVPIPVTSLSTKNGNGKEAFLVSTQGVVRVDEG